MKKRNKPRALLSLRYSRICCLILKNSLLDSKVHHPCLFPQGFVRELPFGLRYEVVPFAQDLNLQIDSSQFHIELCSTPVVWCTCRVECSCQNPGETGCQRTREFRVRS